MKFIPIDWFNSFIWSEWVKIFVDLLPQMKTVFIQSNKTGIQDAWANERQSCLGTLGRLAVT